jgi:hypothetical protein
VALLRLLEAIRDHSGEKIALSATDLLVEISRNEDDLLLEKTTETLGAKVLTSETIVLLLLLEALLVIGVVNQIERLNLMLSLLHRPQGTLTMLLLLPHMTASSDRVTPMKTMTTRESAIE